MDQQQNEEEEDQISPETIKFDFIHRKGVLTAPTTHRKLREFILEDYLKEREDQRSKRIDFAL